ncbi:MAG: M50 family metallopeptidase [Candidatus Acetothermia bacterium]|jgi:regulator of sigma E protease|nr:M50 family metallopeptidase [Candidatus Acetothermia bacterium]MDH7505430.1 M50 family metallopeptidase [Candidatus Acetothermia bacterium]
MSVLVTLIGFLITIGFIVLIHEGGHFLLAKLSGIWVHELALGFGPAILRFRGRETQYSLRIFPIGGYVRVAGDGSGGEEDERVPPQRLFLNKPPLTRMALVLAGPTMNILAALVIMVLVVGLIRVPYLQVADFPPDSPSRGILQEGDRILSAEGRRIYFLEQFQRAVRERGEAGLPLTVEVERGGQLERLTIQPKFEEGRYIIGVYFTGSELTQRVPFPTSLGVGLLWVKNVVLGFYTGFKGLFTGAIPPGEAFTGPVGIASIIGQSLAEGLLPFLTLLAALSLVVGGLINLIPFPGLDGSRAAFILYELIRGKPIPPQRESLVHYIGLVILMGLVLLITYNDILRLLRGP